MAVTQTLENLEHRRMFAAVLGNEQFPNTLYIDGTAGNDVLSLRYRGRQLQVRLNGTLQSFAVRDVTRVEFQAYAGHDIADGSGIAIPTYVNAGAGNDLVVGGTGNDTLTGAAGKDTLRGGAGKDRINGANSPDLLYGDEGSDVIYGGAHDDQMYGGASADWLYGEDGNDRLVGGTHNDRIYGGVGNDRMVGEQGNDLLGGDAGRDLLYGSIGDDTFTTDKDNAVDRIDGGDGADAAAADLTDTHANLETVNGVAVGSTPPVTTPIAKQARGISLNDEALWDANFEQTVAEAKRLGISALRIWIGINTYDERPNAYDVVPEEHLVANWTPGYERKSVAGLAMKRVFELKRQGFNVTVTVNRHGGEAPTSANQVASLFTHLLNATETPGGGTKLKDAVDFWEVGNEPDLPMYWKLSASGKSVGLPGYVDQLLIPAAAVLKAASEKVISAGVSWNPNDLNLILETLQARGQLGLVDAAGYHPYGRVNEIPVRTAQAVGVAAKFGKQIVASEWNVNGYAYDGTQDAEWAAAVDKTYRETILPSTAMNFYFAMVNNQAGRGGAATARPAGLLEHDTSLKVTPTSSFEDLLAYYRSPLVRSDTFYSVYDSW
ncbi:MAG TPA: calcium-binding protein [Tepidisphaeraceae bacterium]|jgi:hypothetical protein